MTNYTPKWKDDKGNVIIFAAPNTLFDELDEARNWQIGRLIFMVSFGLTMAGILEFEAVDGKTEIPHIQGHYGILGDCVIIDGPEFLSAMERNSSAQ